MAGGGIDGIEGRHPAKQGDAYFFRLNCTVGYYSAPGVKSRILAVRSWHPGMVENGMEHKLLVVRRLPGPLTRPMLFR